jgi:nitrogen regulatory protein PII
MLKEQIKIKPHILKKIESALLDSKINNLSSLASVKGVGKQSLEKAFRFSIDNSKVQNSSLDNKKNTMIQGEFLF